MTDAGGRALPAPCGVLFYGNALGEVARLINVAAALQRDIIGEQLERDDRQRREEGILRIRDGHQRVHAGGHLLLAGLGRQGEDARAARLDLDDIAHRLIEQRRIGAKRDDERARLDQ